MVSKMPNRKYAYYRDDQIMFLVTHEKNSISDGQLNEFSKEIAMDLKGGTIKRLPQVFSFPKLTDQEQKGDQRSLAVDDAELFMSPFSIINCNITNGPDDPTELMDIIGVLNENLQGQTLAGLTVRGVSPNWLTSVASQGGATGGAPSGGRPPRHFLGNRKTVPYLFGDLLMSLHTHGLDGDGTGVDVVILDTAPSGHDLVAAPKEWPDHPIISSLLGPNGKLHLYPASYKELLRMGNTSLNTYDYKLTDHGLFVAGIVHSIAPKADIHLIEAMNHCGVGDFMSIVQGLQKVRTEIYDPRRRLVINCSWILEMPCDDLHCRHTNQLGDPDADFERAVLEFSKSSQATHVMLEFLFNHFYALGSQAIAAAGNDGKKEHKQRLASRYPAALENVMEVEATPGILEDQNYKKYRTSLYSKQFDRSRSKVSMPLTRQDKDEEGVLSVYIGEFPDGSPNTSKWAWWSGTSFMTPILTATVAAVLSSSDQIVITQDAIEELYNSEIIEDAEMDLITDDSEAVMVVTPN